MDRRKFLKTATTSAALSVPLVLGSRSPAAASQGLPCPYVTDGWRSDTAKPINEQAGDLFQHLADVHHPSEPEHSVLETLAGKMKDPGP